MNPIEEARRILRETRDAQNKQWQAGMLVGIYDRLRQTRTEDEAMREGCKLFVHYMEALLKLGHLFGGRKGG